MSALAVLPKALKAVDALQQALSPLNADARGHAAAALATLFDQLGFIPEAGSPAVKVLVQGIGDGTPAAEIAARVMMDEGLRSSFVSLVPAKRKPVKREPGDYRLSELEAASFNCPHCSRIVIAKLAKVGFVPKT